MYLIGMLGADNFKKERLRDQCLERRRALDTQRAAELSRCIADRLLALEEVASAEAVHTYVDSFPNEVATRPLIQTLLQRGKRVVVPVVVARRTQLQHAEICSFAELARGPMGIWQPTSGSYLPPVDVFIVPAVTCDRVGNRLGMGGGFYDNLLRQVHQPTIGLLFEYLLVDAVPVEPQDMPVDIVLTDESIYRRKEIRR